MATSVVRAFASYVSGIAASARAFFPLRPQGGAPAAPQAAGFLAAERQGAVGLRLDRLRDRRPPGNRPARCDRLPGRAARARAQGGAAQPDLPRMERLF